MEILLLKFEIFLPVSCLDVSICAHRDVHRKAKIVAIQKFQLCLMTFDDVNHLQIAALNFHAVSLAAKLNHSGKHRVIYFIKKNI